MELSGWEMAVTRAGSAVRFLGGTVRAQEVFGVPAPRAAADQSILRVVREVLEHENEIWAGRAGNYTSSRSCGKTAKDTEA